MAHGLEWHSRFTVVPRDDVTGEIRLGRRDKFIQLLELMYLDLSFPAIREVFENEKRVE